MTKQMMVLVAIILYVLARSLFIEPNSLVIQKHDIEDSYLQGIRIAYLTDFHLRKNDYKKLDKIVRMTRNQGADLVILGGDYFSGSNLKSAINIRLASQKLALFDAPTYAVLGEADWKLDGNEIISNFRANGIRVLENTNQRVRIKNRYVDIIGLGDLKTRKVDIDQAFMRTAMPRIVVTHNPDVYHNIIGRTSLILAGHTHGGQFIIPFSPPLFVDSKYGSDFASGLITSGNSKMIISKGLGMSGLPLRFNCKPEIIIVDFVGRAR